MWSFASNAIAGTIGPKKSSPKPGPSYSNCSDDEASSCTSRGEGLECPICWESFNIVENVPYVLWCGHTLCKNCVLGLQWAVVKFPTLPVQLPLFIACPWCHLLSFRFIFKGSLKFPRKNFFLLWMVESMTNERGESHSSFCSDHQSVRLSNNGSNEQHRDHPRIPYVLQEHAHRNANQDSLMPNYLNLERIHSCLRKSLVFFLNLTAKFPLIIILLIIILYAIPASVTILALYILVTILFALPSFLILYFAYPSLDWLFREIIT